MIVQEVIVNAPLIIISGGIANVARGALSAGARALIASGKLSNYYQWRLKVLRQLKKVKRWQMQQGWKIFILERSRSGLGVEGATFELAHTGLQGEWLFNSPDWAQRIVMSSVTLGALKCPVKLPKSLCF